ncbi:MAG TPA: zf-HC2 domain-containing protein [Bacillota bacterium]|nr:zf-HC2 domain-containing protein [Bacillota bacterium]
MNCRYFQRHFQMKYFDRRMTAEDQKRLWRHLNSCERCRDCFTELQEILGSLSGAPLITPQPDLERRIIDRIKQTPFPTRVPAGSIFAQVPLLLLLMILILGINLRTATLFDLVEPAGQLINHSSFALILIQNIWDTINCIFPIQVSGVMAQLQWISLMVILTSLTLLVRNVVSKIKTE